MGLTVKDMLKRPFFESASILAGENNLHRNVGWVHIIEIEKFGHLLNGEEVILTTGFGWAHDEDKSLSYLQQLLDNNSSALCIELVVHVQELPKKMLQLAEKSNFPIIAFSEEVRFIDITKDLHEQILGKQEDIWQRLEDFHHRLMRTLTNGGSIGDLLKVLHQETNRKIALNYADQYRFFPSPSAKRQQQWVKQIEEQSQTEFFAHPIYLLNDKIGSLLFLEPLVNLSKFDELALKRCSEIIEQFFWRHHHQAEITQLEKNKWILDAISQPVSHENLGRMIQEYKPGILLQEAIIGIKPIEQSLISEDKQESAETNFMMVFRSTLQEKGFELFSVQDKLHRQFILFIINQQSNPILPRLQDALYLLKQKNGIHKGNKPFILAFGKTFHDYEHIDTGYQTALTTLTFQQNMDTLDKPFFQQLGIYRIINQFSSNHELSAIISDYISPLIEHDKKKGTELVKTLQVYLETLGQKNETAAELHIVRQTLYHRLHKIEQLLGEDYMLPENRFMIEFAIRSLPYHSQY